ncbi:MAG TPA: M50 family metallopeptidase [Polyangia bacterium]|nr:M50 family metallopeptidase [Polyangia bacterium]
MAGPLADPGRPRSTPDALDASRFPGYDAVMSMVIAIFGIGVLIALHELGHLWVARAMGMKVVRYSVGFFWPLVKWTSKRSGITWQIGAVPLGGFVQIKGLNPYEDGAFEDADSYQVKAAWRRALVILAGPVTNFLVAFLIFFGLFLVGSPEPLNEAQIGTVLPDRPAAAAGLRDGDRVLAFAGEDIATWDELVSRLHASPEQPIALLIERDGERFEVRLTPELRDGVGLIGIEQPTHRADGVGPGTAAWASLVKCGLITGGSLSALASLVTGSAGNVQTVGPVGIVKMARTAIEVGLDRFLDLLGMLSLMLFLFNLLPLPALDGGRGLMILWEGLSRRRVAPKVDALVNTIGFFLLIGLILAISFKEIVFG